MKGPRRRFPGLSLLCASLFGDLQLKYGIWLSFMISRWHNSRWIVAKFHFDSERRKSELLVSASPFTFLWKHSRNSIIIIRLRVLAQLPGAFKRRLGYVTLIFFSSRPAKVFVLNSFIDVDGRAACVTGNCRGFPRRPFISSREREREWPRWGHRRTLCTHLYHQREPIRVTARQTVVFPMMPKSGDEPSRKPWVCTPIRSILRIAEV